MTGTETSRWGSIGVYTSVLDRSRAYEMAGLKVEMFKAGRLKAAGADGTSLSEEQRAALQASVDSVYAWFKEAVGHRGLSDEAMQGQTFYGREAKDNKIINGVGSMEEAMDGLRTLVPYKSKGF
jgi:protease-4